MAGTIHNRRDQLASGLLTVIVGDVCAYILGLVDVYRDDRLVPGADIPLRQVLADDFDF